jgi:hypothetical protein
VLPTSRKSVSCALLISLALAVIIFVFGERAHLAGAQRPSSLAITAATTTSAVGTGATLVGATHTTTPARAVVAQVMNLRAAGADWRKSLGPMLHKLPDLATTTAPRGPLKGTIMAGTVRLPASVEAHADVTIIARTIEFAEGPVRITTHGHAFTFLPIDSVRSVGAVRVAVDEIVINTSAPTAQSGGPGLTGTEGLSGWNGVPGMDGDILSCGSTSGGTGGNGFAGDTGSVGGAGAGGSAAQNITLDIPAGDQHRYRLIALGGDGGNGGNGGSGGQGGWGGSGGDGGNEYLWGCYPGSGGPGGTGGTGGNGGKGGNGGNGGKGGDVTVTYPIGYDPSWITVINFGGARGAAGVGGAGGSGGFGGFAGQPGRNYLDNTTGGSGSNGGSGASGNPGSLGNDGQSGATGTSRITQASPLTLSVDKTSYGIGEVTLYNVSGAQPNSQILWSSWKDGVSTGEVDAFYGHFTDAQGRWSGQSAPWTTADVASNYTKQVRIAGMTAQAIFEIIPTPPIWAGWTPLPGMVATDRVAVVGGGGITQFVFAKGIDNALYAYSQSLGGVITSAPVAVLRANPPNGSIVDVFARGVDGSVNSRRFRDAGGWEGWQSLGGFIKGTPAVVALGPDSPPAQLPKQLMVFGRGSDDGLYVNHLNGATWSGWQGLGGTLTSDPVAVARGSIVDVFFRGAGGDVIERRWNGSYWESPVGLGGWIEGNIDAAATETNLIFVFARAGQTSFVNQFNGSSWSGWQSLGTAVVSDPAAVAWSNPPYSKVFVAYRGVDDKLYATGWSSMTGTWSNWTSNGGNVSIRPMLTSAQHRMYAIDKDTGTVYERYFEPGL